jgi:hypothetical protein
MTCEGGRAANGEKNKVPQILEIRHFDGWNSIGKIGMLTSALQYQKILIQGQVAQMDKPLTNRYL